MLLRLLHLMVLLLIFHECLGVMMRLLTAHIYNVLRSACGLQRTTSSSLLLLSDPWLVICQSCELIHIQSKSEGYGGHAFVDLLAVLLQLAGRLLVQILHARLVQLAALVHPGATTTRSGCQGRVTFGPTIGVV